MELTQGLGRRRHVVGIVVVDSNVGAGKRPALRTISTINENQGRAAQKPQLRLGICEGRERAGLKEIDVDVYTSSAPHNVDNNLGETRTQALRPKTTRVLTFLPVTKITSQNRKRAALLLSSNCWGAEEKKR